MMQPGLTDEQLLLRTGGLSGTDFNALAMPFVPETKRRKWGPLGVFRSKTEPPRLRRDSGPGDDEEEADDPDRERGLYLEAALRDWYRDRNCALVEETGTLVHPDHPGGDGVPKIMATPDGLAHIKDKPSRALELKAPRFVMSHDWSDDFPHDIHVPPYYLPQVTIEAFVTGTAGTDVVVLLGDEFRLLHVPLDPDYCDDLIYIGQKFWRDHVVTGKPPPIDGTNQYHEYLLDRHPRHLDKPLKAATPDIIPHAVEYARQSEVIKKAEAARKLHRQHLEQFCGDAPGVDFGDNGKITWKNTRDKLWVDYEQLLEYVHVSEHIVKQFQKSKPGPRKFVAALKGII